MKRAFLAVPAAVAFGLLAETGWPAGVDPRLVLADLATGWVLIACGLVVWGRRPTSIGMLLVVTGVAWFAGTLLPAAAFLHRGPLIHVLAAYPSGSVRGVGLRLLVATAYLVSAFAVVSRARHRRAGLRRRARRPCPAWAAGGPAPAAAIDGPVQPGHAGPGTRGARDEHRPPGGQSDPRLGPATPTRSASRRSRCRSSPRSSGARLRPAS